MCALNSEAYSHDMVAVSELSWIANSHLFWYSSGLAIYSSHGKWEL